MSEITPVQTEKEQVQVTPTPVPQETLVDVTPKSQTPEVVKPSAEEERLNKLMNKIGFLERKLQREAEERAQLAQSLQNLKFVPQGQKDENVIDPDLDPEIHRVMETNYQKGIDMMVERKFQAREAERRAQEQRQFQEMELTKSKQKVLERYPNIEDESTDEAKLLIEVLNEDRSLSQNIHGPEIAMYRMEEKMRQRGLQPPYIKEVLSQEQERQRRVSTISSPIGKAPKGDNGRIVLTQDQKEICDRMKIPYAKYHEMLGKTSANFKEGVSVS